MNYLQILDIFIGNKCNLACHQCDTRSDIFRSRQNDPTMAEIKASIRLAQQNFTIQSYSMLGGEPLLYLSEITEIIKFIREYDTVGRIVIPTNGTVLHKKFEEVAHLLTTYNVSLYVCNHYAGFDDKKLSDKIRQTSMEFAQYMNMAPYDNTEFLVNMLDLNNRDNDPGLQQFIDARTDDYMQGNITSTQDVFSNGVVFLWVRDQDRFQSHYYMDIENLPKPFKSGNSEQSYLKGCCSPSCTFLRDSKLYKCSALGTLEKFLAHHDVLEDPDWQKYLNYQPLDLTNCNQEDIANFSKMKFYADEVCDMCPSSSKNFIKTPDKVLPIKLYRKL